MENKIIETKKIKTLQELDLADDFLFFKVMADENICKGVLEKILGIKIKKIKMVVSEKTLKLDLDTQ